MRRCADIYITLHYSNEIAPILTLNGSNDVVPSKDDHFGGPDNGRRHVGEHAPKTPPKRSVNRQCQAKTPKSIHRIISGTLTNQRFENRKKNYTMADVSLSKSEVLIYQPWTELSR